MRHVALLLAAAFLYGCFNPTLRVDGRTALEQQLTRTAILRAITELPIHQSVLEGRWKIDVVSPSGDDKDWTRTLLRQRLEALGANVSTDVAAKLPTVEATVAFAGSDVDNFVVGVPLPGTMGTASISFFHENVQRGRARIRLNFWDAGGTRIAQTPSSSGEAHYGDMFFLTFIGPFSFTDLDDIGTSRRFVRRGADTWNAIRERTPAGEEHGSAPDAGITPAEAEGR